MQEENQDFAERRRHERHAINLGKSLEINGVPTPLMDISWGGISFYTAQSYQVGNIIQFQHGEIAVSATVLGISGSFDEPAHPDYPYRARCQFVEEPDNDSIEALMEYVLDEEGFGF